MTHSHYVMDLYFPDERRPEGLRRDVMRIFAENDAEAVAEAERINGWKQPAHYDIRSIRNSARSGDKLIFTSRISPPRPLNLPPDVPRRWSDAGGSCRAQH